MVGAFWRPAEGFRRAVISKALSTGMKAAVCVALWGGVAIAHSAAAQQPRFSAKEIETLQENDQKYCVDNPLRADDPDDRERYFSLTTKDVDYAVLAFCHKKAAVASILRIRNVDSALMFLAYRPFEPLWSAAERKWGSGLEILRDRLRKDARRNAETIYKVFDRSRTDRARGHAFALLGVGDDERALEVINEELSRLTTEKQLRRSSRGFSRGMAAIGRAAIIDIVDGPEAAARSLGEYLAISPPNDKQYVVNPIINRAAYLAESGQYQAALDLLHPAFDAYTGGRFGTAGYNIRGSDREFAWILACAYTGLGDEKSARPYFDVLDSAKEAPRDIYLLGNTKRSSTIKQRYAACVNDPRYFYEIAFSGVIPALEPSWLDFQPGRKGNYLQLRDDWSVPAEQIERYQEHYRMLPQRFTPALSRWTVVGAQPTQLEDDKGAM
jgi:hypothetical protein